MRLYHGSNVFIDVPDLGKSRPYKDFGRGFYLSADREQAYDLAVQRVNKTRKGEPCVTEFDFNEDVLKTKGLKKLLFDDYSVEWARFVLKNRDLNSPQPCHDYDFVYGPIADDGVTLQLRRHLDGFISIEELVEQLKYSKGITFQYFFGTELALSSLKKIL